MNTVRPLIGAARHRIRTRNTVRAGVYGAWIGVAIGVGLLALSRLWWLQGAPAPWIVSLAALALSAVVGALVGRLRPVLQERELALLVDRALGTDEVLVTLLHLEQEGRDVPAIRADLERRIAALPHLREGVPTGPPRFALWLVPVALAGALLLLVPARVPPAPPTSALAQEAERLAEALASNTDALPRAIQDEIDALLQDLENDAITSEEAVARLNDLQEALSDHAQSQEDAQRDLDALRDASQAAAEPDLPGDLGEAAQELADALEQGDPNAAGQAAEDIADALDGASPQARARASDALREAGEALEGAASPELQQLGEELATAGEQLSGQGGAGGDPSRAADTLRDLKDKVQGDSDLRERLAQDRERLRESQEANGALEASRERLGGEPSPAGQGEPSQQGAGAPGTGLESGLSTGDQGPAAAGQSHTWEDEGTFDTVGDHQDSERLSDRTEGRVENDFESFYDPTQLDGAEGLIVSVDGLIDERGQMDVVDRQLTGGTEKAQRKLLDAPDEYIEAAERALTDDRVPPGYRAAIKDYFDSME